MAKDFAVSIHEPLSISSAGQEPPQTCVGGSLYRFTVAQYHELIDAGILGENDRIELLEGDILHMSPKGPRHVFAVQELSARLAPLLPADWRLRVQDPLTLAESEPEPDLTIVRGSRRDYSARHPGAGEVGVVIEVVDTSLELDRGVKQRVYAAAGIPVYWLVNLAARNVEVFSLPSSIDEQTPASYQSRRVLEDQGAIEIELAGQRLGEIRIADLLPPLGEQKS